MKYTQSKFTLPAGSSKITQEQWDAAFHVLPTPAIPDEVWRALEAAELNMQISADTELSNAVEASRVYPFRNVRTDVITRRRVSK